MVYWYFFIYFFEKDPVFPFYCSVLNKRTIGTIFNPFGIMRSLIGD